MMRRILLVLFLVYCLAPNLSNCQGNTAEQARASLDATPRIKGVDAPEGRFPYMCSLRMRGNRNHVCGAVLIHPEWILTAAHCVDGEEPGSTGLKPIVYCGIYSINEEDPERIFTTVEDRIHEKWTGNVEDGLANLQVAPRNTFGNTPATSSLLAALGWGETANGQFSDTLQIAATLRYIGPRSCNSNWAGILPPDITICAGAGVEDTCKGDSGGPLLIADGAGDNLAAGNPAFDLVYGITSFGPKRCGDGSRPGVYTDVGFFEEWIECTINPNAGSCRTDTPTPGQQRSGSGPRLSDQERERLETEILEAIRTDDAEKVQEILDMGLDVNSVVEDPTDADVFEYTLLHWTAFRSAHKSAKVLVDNRADIEARNKFDNTPLHNAAIFDASAVATVLLESGAEVDSIGSAGSTPLNRAAEGSIDVVIVLLRFGADVNSVDEFGETALITAAFETKPDIVRLLISNGADVNIADKDGETALIFAAFRGSLEIVNILIRAGADVNAANDQGITPLYDAVGNEGFVRIVEVLIENGAFLDAKDENGTTPLHLAAIDGKVDIVQVLVDAGADVNVVDNRDQTPLHYAAVGGSIAVVHILIANGAEIDAIDNSGETPLLEAADEGHLEIVNLLIQNGANVNLKRDDLATPLHFAALNGHIAVVQALIAAGAEINALTELEDSPLASTVFRNRVEVARVLIESGADVDLADRDGLTPLHVAAQRGLLPMIEVLLDGGASKTARSNAGNRPIDLLCANADPPCSATTRATAMRLLTP